MNGHGGFGRPLSCIRQRRSCGPSRRTPSRHQRKARLPAIWEGCPPGDGDSGPRFELQLAHHSAHLRRAMRTLGNSNDLARRPHAPLHSGLPWASEGCNILRQLHPWPARCRTSCAPRRPSVRINKLAANLIAHESSPFLDTWLKPTHPCSAPAIVGSAALACISPLASRGRCKRNLPPRGVSKAFFCGVKRCIETHAAEGGFRIPIGARGPMRRTTTSCHNLQCPQTALQNQTLSDPSAIQWFLHSHSVRPPLHPSSATMPTASVYPPQSRRTYG